MGFFLASSTSDNREIRLQRLHLLVDEKQGVATKQQMSGRIFGRYMRTHRLRGFQIDFVF
jgi:hypothetical protein